MDCFDGLCREGERIDDLLSPPFKVIQHRQHFRFGIDAVLLANFIKIREQETLVDLGTGAGVIPLIVMGRQCPRQIVGIEIQSELTHMAQRSVFLNNLAERISIMNMDLRGAAEQLGYGSADVVSANPPYWPLNRGNQNAVTSIAIARHEVRCTLEDIMKTAGQLLKFRGRFYLIHLAERLADIMVFGRKYQLEPKLIRPVQSLEEKPAKFVLLEMIKGACSALKLAAPLVIYKKPGDYTEEVLRYYCSPD